jgi:transposase
MLGVAWNTVWDAVTPVIKAQLAAEERLVGVNALGVDEHVWRHVGPPGPGWSPGSWTTPATRAASPGRGCWIW